jgi:hypothetical protein
MMALYAAIVLGAAWIVLALVARADPGFILHGVFEDLGLLFWIAFTVLGLALVGTLSWVFLTAGEAIPEPAKARIAPLDPVKLAPAWNPADAPTGERTTCARCQRTLPPWRMPEGTCTVCAPFSVFLDPPKRYNAELERRRNRLFLLQGLGLALLALAFVSAVYLFPVVLAPERPVLATLAFLVFSPLLFGLVLLSYARSQAVQET